MKPRAMKRGGAKKMMRGGKADTKMMRGGGTPIKGGKVKKTRAGGGNMSSTSLRRRILEDSLARDRNIGRTYADRGAVGSRKAKEELDREIREYAKDSDLIGTYGRDAPNARSFNTRRAAGGAVKKMQAGGKLKMVEKDGKKVPSFAADGVGKMKRGGATKKMMRGGMAKKK
jgi:hypothetical protein